MRKILKLLGNAAKYVFCTIVLAFVLKIFGLFVDANIENYIAKKGWDQALESSLPWLVDAWKPKVVPVFDYLTGPFGLGFTLASVLYIASTSEALLSFLKNLDKEKEEDGSVKVSDFRSIAEELGAAKLERDQAQEHMSLLIINDEKLSLANKNLETAYKNLEKLQYKYRIMIADLLVSVLQPGESSLKIIGTTDKGDTDAQFQIVKDRYRVELSVCRPILNQPKSIIIYLDTWDGSVDIK